MNNTGASKGSQWRKWDLHVHTPASFHWSGGKLLREMDAEEKKATFQQLLRTIENTDIAVFCFMDYWTFEGYIQFKQFLKDANVNCSKTIFPGMELRVEAPVNYRLNIHVILSDQLSVQQLHDFRSKLVIRSINRSISDEAIIQFAKSLDVSKAKVHGFDATKGLGTNDLLKLGASTIEITKESLHQAMQSIPRGQAYIMLPYDTSDGLDKLDWKTHSHADNYFMQTAHLFESREDEVIDLFLNNETAKNRDFIKNFQKTLNNIQKPVICGSDAHRFADYGKFPGNKVTWIKADPTFEGFKQIIYEPRERVLIQELQPQEKIPYKVIDKIRFVDNTNKNFSSDWIHINENLNVIIGGKSSGKSLLLYRIAKTVAPTLIEERKREVSILDYRFGSPHEFDFEVAWLDGHCDKLSDPARSNVREIEYIPQLYVNSLAERQGRNSLYKLIESILEQNTAYREFIQLMRQDISKLEIAIQQDLSELLLKRDDLKALLNERKLIGDEKAIAAEIERLTEAIRKLRKDSTLTEKENSDYQILLNARVKAGRRKKEFEEIAITVESFVKSLEQVKAQVTQSIGGFGFSLVTTSLQKRVVSSMRSFSMKSLENTLSFLIASYQKLASSARQKTRQSEDAQANITQNLKPYSDKILDQTRLKDFETKLEDQRKSLEAFNKKTTEIESVIQIGTKLRESVFYNYSNLTNCYVGILEKLKDKTYSKIDDDIFLDATLSFKTEAFSGAFGDLFNRRQSRFSSIFGSAFADDGDFKFNLSSHQKTIREIFDKLSKAGNDIVFRKDATANQAIIELLKNYFYIDYNIRYRNDEILDMSPGKRGLVLLQLILHISNASHPILIDQPEDNLDNRTISNELRHFVTSKKLARQIIMVTHDANLVVLTDAENVIVSNQDGQQINRENRNYRFEYIAGALENSFRLGEEQNYQGILYSCGIREHVCDVLEGGEMAFKKREEKYGFANRVLC